MSAAATVLSFRYRAPRPICPINVKASKAIQHAQAVADTGLAQAEGEMRAAGYDRETAQHLARMVLLQFFDAFDGEDDIAANDVFYGLRDRITREAWIKRIGTGGRP
jgi:hypothetical protein